MSKQQNDPVGRYLSDEAEHDWYCPKDDHERFEDEECTCSLQRVIAIHEQEREIISCAIRVNGMFEFGHVDEGAKELLYEAIAKYQDIVAGNK